MERLPHRSVRQWLADHIRGSSKERSQNPGSNVNRTSELIAGQPEAISNQIETTGGKDEPGSPTAAGVNEISVAEDAGKVEETDDPSPIWTTSMESFAKERAGLNEVIKDRIKEIQQVDVDNWDTWLNVQCGKSQSTWFRRCKSYLPRVKTVKTLAVSLSNLDPHKIAPCVTTGLFVLLELCFESVDPSIRDQVMSIILKTSILISKWADLEPDIRQMKVQMKKSSGLWKIEKIEEQLLILYLDSLELISSIYSSGKSRASRFKANIVADPGEWEIKYQKLDERSSACLELKTEAESELKRIDANIAVLNWIGPRKGNPEPAHQTIRERTSINDSDCTAGKWFLETNEFTSWIDGIRQRKEEKLVFWLNGAMGTDAELSPILKIRPSMEFDLSITIVMETIKSKPPTYETILRALCARLSWSSDGRVAESSRNLYDTLKRDPETQTTTKSWETLLKDLVSSSPTPIVFIIDALDECNTPADHRRLLKFLNSLREIQGAAPYCLISSRLHVRVTDFYPTNLVRVLSTAHLQMNEDMKRFIAYQIDLKKKDDEWKKSIFFQDRLLHEKLISTLSQNAGVMFRWVEIWLGVFFPKNKKIIRRRKYAETLLDELRDIRSLDKLPDKDEDERLDGENKVLHTAYMKLWDINGGDQYKDLQVRVFQIFMGALDRLKPQQLIEAARLDLESPDDYSFDLESDEVEGLYCNFLGTDSEGFLRFEHLSAEIFISEIQERDTNELTFSKEKSSLMLASLCNNAIERPHHPVWKLANIDLVDWNTQFKTALGTNLDWDNVDTKLQPIFRILENKTHFGAYIFRNWQGQCRQSNHNGQFSSKIVKLCQDMGPSFEGWLLIWSYLCEYRDATVKMTQQGRAICSESLLSMVKMGFSPFFRNDQSLLVLLPGFEDITTRESGGTTALHIASGTGENGMVADLLEFDYAQRGIVKNELVAGSRLRFDERDMSRILFLTDSVGHTPLYYASTPDVIMTLLKYEAVHYNLYFPPRVGAGRHSILLGWRDQAGRNPVEYGFMMDHDPIGKHEITQWINQRYLKIERNH